MRKGREETRRERSAKRETGEEAKRRREEEREQDEEAVGLYMN